MKQMRFSNDGKSWSGWGPYATSKTWALAKGTGTRTVYAEYWGGAGNVSAPSARDAIRVKRR